MKLSHLIGTLALLGNVAGMQAASVAQELRPMIRGSILGALIGGSMGHIIDRILRPAGRMLGYIKVRGKLERIPIPRGNKALGVGAILGAVSGLDVGVIMVEALRTESLIHAIITPDNEQLDDLLKNNKTFWRNINPNLENYIPFHEADYPHLQGSPPLLWATDVSNAYACQALLSYKPPHKDKSPVNINATTRDEQTALHIAVSSWLTTRTLDRNVDVYPQWLLIEKRQQTAKNLIALFIEHGADVTLKDNNGLTIFDLIQNKEGLSDEYKTEITEFIHQCVTKRSQNATQ